jgi:hypothetical protein
MKLPSPWLLFLDAAYFFRILFSGEVSFFLDARSMASLVWIGLFVIDEANFF